MSLNWRGAWASGQTYQINDVVFYLTASYVALAISTNVAPTEANLGVYWAAFAIGLTGAQGPRGATGQTSTVAGPQGSTGVSGPRGADGQGFSWRSSWSSTTTYNAYDCVSYANNSYICIVDGVQNVAPGTDISKWNLLCEGGSSFSGSYTDLTNKPNFATVATSGSYTDLTNKPTIPSQTNSDWNATTGAAQILNKPTLATVATSGAYTDLSGKPSLATVATSGAYADLTGKPTLATVATTGSYTDLTNKPSSSGAATFTQDVTFTAAGTQTITHALNTLNAAVQVRWTSGSKKVSVAVLDANSIALTSVGAMTGTVTLVAPTESAPTNAAPTVVLQPKTSRFETAGAITFSSTAAGYPTPTVQWKSSPDGLTWTDVSGATNDTLHFTLTGQNGFYYKCVFTNTAGTVESNPARLLTVPDITTGLVNYWPMNEGSGTGFVDVIGGDNGSSSTITWTGTEATWAISRVGGPNTIPTPLTNWAINQPATFTLWLTAPTGSGGVLLSNCDAFQQPGLEMYYGSGGLTVLLENSVHTGVYAGLALAGSLIPDGVRTHIAFTYDGSGVTAGMRIYINGVQAATTISADALAGQTITPIFGMGYFMRGANESGYNGGSSIDHMRNYNRALTASDIAALVGGNN
jgi:hypothetical protein